MGLCVSDDGQFMAVSYANDPIDFEGATEDHCIRVYDLKSTKDPFCTLRVGGKIGEGPCQFNMPHGLCFEPLTMHVLVCDFINDRIQTISIDDGSQVRSVIVPAPLSVACKDDCMVVGTHVAPFIRILNRVSGECRQSFGTTSQIGVRVSSSVACCVDSSDVVALEYCNQRVSCFTESGLFVKHIGVGELSTYSQGVLICAPNEEIIVSDMNNDRVCVFSCETGALVREWGSKGFTDGQFVLPKALALVGRRLFVLDFDESSSRVQVFE